MRFFRATPNGNEYIGVGGLNFGRAMKQLTFDSRYLRREISFAEYTHLTDTEGLGAMTGPDVVMPDAGPD